MQTAQQAHDILTLYMTERNMRKTPERYAVMDTLMQAKGHFSADQILAMMPSGFHVSRGTVYNTLALLVECGLAYEYHLGDVTLYERAYSNLPHSHYICTECGKIWDLRDPRLEKAASSAKTPKFKKTRSCTYIYGMCSACLSIQAKAKKKMEKEMEKERLSKMTREEKRFARISEELEEASGWMKRD